MSRLFSGDSRGWHSSGSATFRGPRLPALAANPVAQVAVPRAGWTVTCGFDDVLNEEKPVDTSHPQHAHPAPGRAWPKFIVVVLIIFFAAYAVRAGHDATAAVAAAAALGYGGVEAARRLYAH
jgi:hypothetical protein